MNSILSIWTFLSGKKTVIAAISYALADILTAVGQIEIAEGVRKLAYGLTVVGLGHKAVKK